MIHLFVFSTHPFSIAPPPSTYTTSPVLDQALQTTIVHDAQLIIDLLEKNGANVRQIGIPPVHVKPNK